ncbi:hypothetical protein PCANB_002820 [Pneumocystis canis]|nr:hypothetical protein PCANB_002820 [Pneumocystis canis]
MNSEKALYNSFSSFRDKLKLKGCKIDDINTNYKNESILSLKMMTIKKIAEFSGQLTDNILKLIPWNGIGEYLWKEIESMGYDSFKLWKIFVEVYFNSITSADVFNRTEIFILPFISIFKEIDCISLCWLNILDISNNKTLSTEDFIYISYLHNLIALNVSNTNLTDMILNHWGRAAQKEKFLQLLYIDIRNNKCSVSCFISHMTKFKSLLYFSIEDYQQETIDFFYEKYSYLRPSYKLIECILQCNTFQELCKCIFDFHSHSARHSIICHLFIKSGNRVLMKKYSPPLLFYAKVLKNSILSLNTCSTKGIYNISKISIPEKNKIYKRIKHRQIENWNDIKG